MRNKKSNLENHNNNINNNLFYNRSKMTRRTVNAIKINIW